MKKNTLKLVLVVVLFATANVVFSQTAPSRTPPPPPGVPLDGGLFALIALGVGIAIKKIGFKK